jgi:hypothetical protein
MAIGSRQMSLKMSMQITERMMLMMIKKKKMMMKR